MAISLLELTTCIPQMPLNQSQSIYFLLLLLFWGSMPQIPLVVMCYTPPPRQQQTLEFSPPQTENPV